MKLRFAAALAACLFALGVAAADAPSRIAVDWTDPAQFADTRENQGTFQIKPEEWLRQLSRHLQSRADRVVPAGQRLEVTFTDIARAGRVEPWRGPQWSDVRIIKNIYPPRIDLHFRLLDQAGKVVREGDRQLRDPSFMDRAVPSESDPLRYEKRMLDDWLRKEFPDTSRS
jgi:hypothetical protein